jgi:hypothetical protein
MLTRKLIDKTMKNLIFIFTLVTIGLSSCKKDLIENATPTNNTSSINQFKEIKTSENFDWKTTKEITLNVYGYKTINTVSGTLRVSTVDDKIIFHQALQTMEQSGTIKLTIPSHIKDVKISFGSIQKTFNTSQSTIEFEYLTPISE